MKNFALALAVAALAGGCATYERVMGSEHSDFTINCPLNQLEICFGKAKELCPKGYTVLNTRRPFLPADVIGLWDQIVVRCET